MKSILALSCILLSSCFSFEEISDINGKLQTGVWVLDPHDGTKYTCVFDDKFTIYDSLGCVLWVEDWHISNYFPFESCNPNLFEHGNPFHPQHDHSGILLLHDAPDKYLYVNQDGLWSMGLYR